MSDKTTQLEERIGRKVNHKQQLSELTRLADTTILEYYLEVEKNDDLVTAVRAGQELGIPIVVTGTPAKLSFPGEMVAGLVIKNNCRKFDKMSMRGKISGQGLGISEVLVQAEAGTPINQLVRFTIEEGLMGLEYQLGMEGTVGDALVVNAGYKREKARDALHAVQVITQEGTVMTYMDDFAKHLEEEILLTAIFQMIPVSKNALWERGREAAAYRSEQVGKN